MRTLYDAPEYFVGVDQIFDSDKIKARQTGWIQIRVVRGVC